MKIFKIDSKKNTFLGEKQDLRQIKFIFFRQIFF